MADIELVIKIPEEAKQAFDCAESNDLKGCYYDHGGVIGNAIKNGTPLPKGHGDLKDFDKIEWYGCDLEGRGCIEAKGDCSVCNHANCYANQVRELPTIIEADKEYDVEIITRGNCMMCGKELGEGLFFCKECEQKQKARIRNEVGNISL